MRVCRVGGSADTAPNPLTCTVVKDLGKVTTVTDPNPIADYATAMYWVFAHDDFGHYAAGVSINVVGPPDPVTNAAASAYDPTRARITWTAPKNTTARICRTAAGADAPRFGDCDGAHLYVTSAASYLDLTALPGRAYVYYIYATGGQGQFSVPAATPPVTLTTPAGAAVEGTVTAADAPDGVSGIHVSLIAPNGRAVSDSDGDGVLDSDVLATTTTHLEARLPSSTPRRSPTASRRRTSAPSSASTPPGRPATTRPGTRRSVTGLRSGAPTRSTRPARSCH